MSQQDTQFKKGQSGNPNGRPVGAKSIKRFDVAQILGGLGYCPFTHLYKMANDPTWSKRERTQAACELAGYVSPKLKAIEISADELKEGFSMVFNVNKEKVADGVDNVQRNEDGKPVSS